MSIVFLLKSFGNTDVFRDFEMENYEWVQMLHHLRGDLSYRGQKSGIPARLSGPLSLAILLYIINLCWHVQHSIIYQAFFFIYSTFMMTTITFFSSKYMVNN